MSVWTSNTPVARRVSVTAAHRKEGRSRVSKPSVHLVSNDNGVGLSTDMELLEGMLTEEGYEVRRYHWRQQSMPRCDVAIFLEMYNPALARYAAKKVGIFNLEWFPSHWRPHLRKFDQLWAKSREAEEIFTKFGLRSHYTGFMSRDLYDPNVPRTETCLHLRGKSSLKGTEAVLEAWNAFDDLPPLTIIAQEKMIAPNSVKVLTRMPEKDLVRELNTHRIHVCPSKSEGWGHYITEGMSTGAVIVTTDASPMSDHVQPGRGLLLPVRRTSRRHMAQEYHTSPVDLAHQVRAAMGMGERRRAVVGSAAREHIINGNATFRKRALELLRSL